MTIRNICLFLLFSISVGCQKDDENGMDFKITGLRDTVIERGQNLVIPIKVFYLGGAKEKVSITASPASPGVSVAFDPNNQEPNFNLNLFISATALADTGIYTITITGTGESKKTFVKDFILHVTKVMNSAPVIFLNQGDTVSHRLNDPWFDPGYTATDVEDGTITGQVITGGIVNVNLAGNYLLTYQVTDNDGLTTNATRLVRVLNDAAFINGNYTCTTISSASPVHIWTTTLATSGTINNRFTVFKLGDCFMANPDINLDPVTDSIFMSTQSFTCISATDTLLHTFFGIGKVTPGAGSSVAIELVYTDSYVDPGTGSMVTVNKRDIYNK